MEPGKGEAEGGDSEELEIHVEASLYEEVNSWLNKTVTEVKEEISNKKRRQDIRGWFRTESKTTGATPKEAEEKSSKEY